MATRRKHRKIAEARPKDLQIEEASLLAIKPTGGIKHLYIHIPFCYKKCDYCAFYSEENPSDCLIETYLNYLEEEFLAKSAMCSNLKTIYIGGGTPSLLNTSQLKKLFTLIKKYFSLNNQQAQSKHTRYQSGDQIRKLNPTCGTEISIECNPSTLDEDKIATIAKFANRVSLGIQSFNCEFRKTIGRHGSIKNIDQIIKLFIKYGIENIGCDLIYAIPNQNLSDWKLELKKATALPIKHISTYSLTYEEGTQLAENEATMWELSNSFLADKQFTRYEISNFSKPGFESKHNSSIWQGESYLGCGPTAASFDGTDRWINPSSLTSWLNNEKSDLDKITKKARAREIFVMGLRTSQGWNLETFKTISEFEFTEWQNNLDPLISNKLLIYKNKNISCSKKGFLLWNEIAERLI